MTLTEEKLETVGNLLVSTSSALSARFRALFTLRNAGGVTAIDFISKTLLEDTSALLKHECAYCLGQMQDKVANDVLVKVLRDREEHPMVRHEAGEALGAIGSPEMLDVLREYADDSVLEVAQTCQLAIKRIEGLREEGKEALHQNPYSSVDPTPPADLKLSLPELRHLLFSPETSLFDKYRAMFSLRNKGTDDAVRVLGEALVSYKDDPNNALLKHEVAYVFGQIQSPVSVPYLKELLEERRENEMVRHECAEALGSIANEEANELLLKFKEDKVRIVRESIEVALDMVSYENSDQFQPIDNLTKN